MTTEATSLLHIRKYLLILLSIVTIVSTVNTGIIIYALTDAKQELAEIRFELDTAKSDVTDSIDKLIASPWGKILAPFIGDQ